jgi:hypothetical protein
LKAEDIRHFTQHVLQAHVPWNVHGYRCQTEMILDVLLKASAESSSLEAASADLEGSADSNTIREYLNFHDEPFYGHQEALREVTCHGQAKKGTTHFVRIATAYVIWRQVRLTLAVRYVLPEDETRAVLQCLLARLKELGIHSRVLYLDKGFARGAVIRHLQEQRQPAIIACPIRGKAGAHVPCAKDGAATPPLTPSAIAPK